MSCHPCDDPYWTSLGQFLSWELTGGLVGGVVAGALSLTIKGEIRNVKIGLKDQIDGWGLISRGWMSNPITIQSSAKYFQEVKLSVIKGAALGLVVGGICFYVQCLTRELVCFGYSSS